MRTRFRERPAAQQRGWVFMAAVGTVGVLAVLLLVYIGFKAPDKIPGRSYYNLQAKFDEADNLTGHYQVRDGGKLVGQVLDPRVENGKAIVDLQLDPSIKPLRSDTTIEVRPRSAVGVRYVDIKPGQHGTPLKDGAVIPASQTHATEQLDEVLSTFDPDTRRNAQRFMQELGKGFAGRGEDLNEAIGGAASMLQAAGGTPQGGGAAASMLRASSGWLTAIADRQDGIKHLIEGGGTIADSADPVRRTIATGFEPAAKALDPFTSERKAVHDILDKAPSAFTTVRSGLSVVNPLVDELEGFAHNIRPGLKAGPYAFRQTAALLSESRPGLRDAKGTLDLANRAVSPTLSLLDTVRPVLPNLDSTLANGTPIISSLGAYGCDFVNFGRRWTSMLQYGNGEASMLRFNLTASAESIYGQTKKRLGGAPRNPYPKPCVSGHEVTGGSN